MADNDIDIDIEMVLSSWCLKVFNVGAETKSSCSEFQAFVRRLVKNSALRDFCNDTFLSVLLCHLVDVLQSNGMKSVDTCQCHLCMCNIQSCLHVLYGNTNLEEKVPSVYPGIPCS